MIIRNLAKLNQLMGFQRSHAITTQKVQPISDQSKVEDDQKNDNIIGEIIISENTITFPNLQNYIPSVVNPTYSDATYDSWVREHPSALGSFDLMMKEVKGKKVVVFLDYDGTLSPIVDEPDRAFMSDEMRAAVRQVAKYFPTAIISGRSREKVKEFVKLNNVYYAGSHGMDIVSPPRAAKSIDISKYSTIAIDNKANQVPFQPAKEFLPAIQSMQAALEENVRKIKGAKVENNRFCISVHFRNVREEDYGLLEEKVKSVLVGYPDFCSREGIKVIEIRPFIEWNKGHALEYLLDALGLSKSSDVLPIYIGDDRTDEDAFKALKSRGQGYPIIVSTVAKETEASHSLRDPSEVLSFLLKLARWRRSSSTSFRALSQVWAVED